ncbi:glutamate receptor 2.9-like [Syzygium oleosum]|uniref:glutamate receptor 2.9-like n=1 Tax=Syzygium oleosum TaxID=219896 RepID=UPI0011D252CA|nr:glutamate receptor 2.9-like [Syzygium oleosum]
MGFLQSSCNRSARHILSISKLFLLLSPLLLPSYSGAATRAMDAGNVFKVGVILDLDSRLGDQMRMAIEIACQDANSISSSGSHYIKPRYINSHAKPLRAISAAEKLIKRKNVQVIIGLETWEGATLVAEIANQSQVPVISFARDNVTPTLMAQTLWPSLFRMSTDESDQIKCIVDVVSSYNRRRVSIIYEAGAYDTMYSKLLNSLSEELGKIGSTIEDQLILQAFSSPTGAEVSLEENLMKLKGKASPIFIVLGLSSPGSAHFLKEAKKMGLFYADSIWIFAEKPFANLLNSAEQSAISSTVEGAIGVITYRPENQAYREFKSKFLNMFRHKYGENFNFEPDIDAVRAYDCIMAVKNAVDAVPNHDIMPGFLLNRILRTRLTGLSGPIRFEKGQLAHRPKFQLVSVNGNEYRELKLWSPNFGFSGSFVAKQSSRRNSYAIADRFKTQEGQTSGENKPMVIGVPGKTPFDKFVKEEMDGTTGKANYIGFCIDVFEKVVSHFPERFDYKFSRHDGTYEDLVNKVRDKTYDAAVGDITILANRSQYVEFTQPFIASDLTMIVPAKRDTDRALIFMQPFTPTMWIASGGILVYTMLVVWFLERPINPEFRGPWTNQLSTALWFTFSSLFFAHRERVYRNFTRIVLVIWFFVALILTQSYTAGLTSLLTLQELKPTVTTMEWLRISKARVGCDPDAFICDYLTHTLNFSKEAIVGISNTSSYGDEFRRGNIAALFLEYPYERAFFTEYCYGYVATQENYRFGGFGFVFPKGSRLAANFSEAILELSESGEMKRLEYKWFPPECTMRNFTNETPRLGLNSFWALYALTIATSTGCFLFACLCTRRNRQDHEQGSAGDNMSVTEMSIL